MNRALVIAIISLTAITWLITAISFGLPTTWIGAARPFLTAVTVSTAFLFIFDRWLWGLKGLRCWIAKTPNLKGAWRLELQSNYVDPDTGNQVHRTGYAQIDQRANTLIVRIFTENSKSKTYSWAIDSDDHVFSLAIVYDNQPRIMDRQNRSHAHQGAAVFSFRGYRPKELRGEYWTERPTLGEMRLFERQDADINSYEEGTSLYGDD